MKPAIHRTPSARFVKPRLLCVALILACCVHAEPDKSILLANLSFEELAQIKINIASISERPVREQPAIVSVVTSEQTRETGARDLMDVLALVPGFSFQTDVSTTVGTGFRGFWAYEGKMLVLLDGIPVNDGLWGNVQMGHHYSASQIKQIEIIRGPGSARYGGNAELAVVNVTTKGAEQNGGFFTVRPEAVPGQIGIGLDAGLGYTLKNDWRYSLGLTYENFVRSDQQYVSQAGTVVDMRRHSKIEPYLLNAAIGWKDLDLRLIYDNYRFKNPIANGEPPAAYPGWSRLFRSLMGSAKLAITPSDSTALTPRITFQHQEPWRLLANPGRGDFNIHYNKWDLDVPCITNINERNHLLAGITGFRETAEAVDTAYLHVPRETFFKGSNHVDYHDLAVYAQYDLETDWAAFSVGGRWERHSYAGYEFVPRISITRSWELFHVKILYDQAFRTPNIDDIYFQLGSTAVTHEKTTSYQLETGYRFGEHLTAVANLYAMRIEKPIVFTVSGNNFGAMNGGPLANHGGEFELRYIGADLSASLGYSYYRADDSLSGETLGLYGSSVDGQNLAQPTHKISGSVTLHINPKLDWNVSGTHTTATRAWVYPGLEQKLSPELNLNTFLNWRWKRLDSGIGIRNLLNENIRIGQAYNGGSAPLPLLRRSVFLKLTWHF